MPKFPSPEWLDAYAAAIASSDELKDAARSWEGDLTLVVESEPDKGIPEVWAWFDLSHGDFRGAKIVTQDVGERALFVIRAAYATWKDVIRGRIEPIKGMTQGKLRLSGDLPKIKENVRAVAQLVTLAGQVSSGFVDE